MRVTGKLLSILMIVMLLSMTFVSAAETGGLRTAGKEAASKSAEADPNTSADSKAGADPRSDAEPNSGADPKSDADPAAEGSRRDTSDSKSSADPKADAELKTGTDPMPEDGKRVEGEAGKEIDEDKNGTAESREDGSGAVMDGEAGSGAVGSDAAKDGEAGSREAGSKETGKEKTGPELLESDLAVSKADEVSYDYLYILNHADARYLRVNSLTLEGMIHPVTVARGIATYNAAKQRNFSLESGNFIASLSYEIPVYDVDPNGRYYVAKPDVNLYGNAFESYDFTLIYNNNQAEAIPDYHYERGLVYIPKSAVDHPANRYELIGESPLAMQMNYCFRDGATTDEEGNLNLAKRLPVTILAGKEPERKTVVSENLFDSVLSIPIGDYRKENISVFVNGMMMPVTEDAYEVTDGVLMLHTPAAILSGIQVVADSRARVAAGKLMRKLVPEAYAAVSMEEMDYFKASDGTPVTLNADLTDLFVGWRGYYDNASIQFSGRSIDGAKGDSIAEGGDGKTGSNSSRIDKLKALKGWKNSVRYLYGGYAPGNTWDAGKLDALWAIASYTVGSNLDPATSDTTLTRDKKVLHDGEKKTIYEWMMQYRNTLEKSNGDYGSNHYAGASGSNGLGGFTNFAFHFPGTVKGCDPEDNFVSDPEQKGYGRKNSNLKFTSDEIDSTYYLAAYCSHLDEPEGTQEGSETSRIYVSCIGIGTDYAVFAFTTANQKSGQNGSAIYKFKTGSAVRFRKESANTGISEGNACYQDLSGAVYGIYSSEEDARADQNRLKTFTTKAGGETDESSVVAGTYYAREIKAPRNYARNEAIVKVTVTGKSEVQTFRMEDLPQNEEIALLIRKLDRETGKPVPLGNATLAGAEFEVRYYDGTYTSAADAEKSGEPTRSWVFRTDEAGEIHPTEENALVSGDPLYENSAGKVTFPVGTYLMKETKAPKGYRISEEVILRNVTGEGEQEAVHTWQVPDVREQVIRGDLRFNKIEGDTGKRLQNTVFRLTSRTTGESHILVTDQNGQANTAASWNSHRKDTNANDEAVEGDVVTDERLNPDAGIWFFLDREGNEAEDVKDELGALPYDQYLLTELRCRSNEGKKLLESIELSITRDGEVVNFGTLTNVTEQLPKDPAIRTSAEYGKTGEKNADPSSEAEVIDRVFYSNLTAGETYVIAGILMDKESGKALLDAEGEPVYQEVTVTPEQPDGEAQVSFRLDTRTLEGHSVVAFEALLLGEEEIACHRDINDAAQTVFVGREGPTEPSSPITPEKTEVVETGDAGAFGSVLLFALAAGALLLMYWRRKEAGREE